MTPSLHAHVEELVRLHQQALATDPEQARVTRQALLAAIQGLIVTQARKYVERVKATTGVQLDTNEAVQECYLIIASRIDSYTGSNKPDASLIGGWVSRLAQVELAKSETRLSSPVTFTDWARKQSAKGKDSVALRADAYDPDDDEHSSGYLDYSHQLTEEEHEEKEEMLTAIEEAMHVLSPLQRAIVEMHHYDCDVPGKGASAGMYSAKGLGRIAKELGMTQQAVAKEYQAAIQKLKDECL